jgi:hypothetical protein
VRSSQIVSERIGLAGEKIVANLDEHTIQFRVFGQRGIGMEIIHFEDLFAGVEVIEVDFGGFETVPRSVVIVGANASKSANQGRLFCRGQFFQASIVSCFGVKSGVSQSGQNACRQIARVAIGFHQIDFSIFFQVLVGCDLWWSSAAAVRKENQQKKNTEPTNAD